jgi:hypothetical protein
MVLYPGFFAHRTIFGFSWRQPKEADIGKLVTNPELFQMYLKHG